MIGQYITIELFNGEHLKIKINTTEDDFNKIVMELYGQKILRDKVFLNVVSIEENAHERLD